MTRTSISWPLVRLAGGAAIVAVLVWRLGTGPFVEGLRRVEAGPLAAAAAIALPTTLCCAWRWQLVARGLGIDLRLGTAVGAYYRSQFLNSTLPGGVLGDVHRAVSHGRAVGDLSRSVRAVVWERVAGQVVLAMLTVAALLLLPAMRPALPLAVVLLALAGGTVLLVGGALPLIVMASGLAVTGHVATFLLAARTAGSTASLAQLLPLALLVLVASGIPLNVAGWGPREGAAAGLFAAAGLGAELGVATAVVFGVMVLVASLPGVAVLVLAWVRAAQSDLPPALPVAVAVTERTTHG